MDKDISVYVTVDETGNLGKSMKNERFYSIVACVVSDRKRFEDATRRLNIAEEVKFNTHRELRETVLDYASPAVSDVFYVCYRKDRQGMALESAEKEDLHIRMLRSLADAIVLRYGDRNDLVIDLDENSLVSDSDVIAVFVKNEYRRRNNSIICNVDESKYNYGLQTNDFFVGAIGFMLNRSDKSYVRTFENEPYEAHLRSKNRRTGRSPPPHRRVRTHTDHRLIGNDALPGLTSRSNSLTPSHENGPPKAHQSGIKRFRDKKIV